MGGQRAVLLAADREREDDGTDRLLRLDFLGRLVDARQQLAAVVGGRADGDLAERFGQGVGVAGVVHELHDLPGHRAERELGLAEQPLHERGRAGPENPGAVVVHDDGDAERGRGDLGFGHLTRLAVFLDDEVGGGQIEDRRALRVGDGHEDGALSRCGRRGRGEGGRERERDRRDQQAGHDQLLL